MVFRREYIFRQFLYLKKRIVQHWAFNKNITPEFTFYYVNFETIS